LIAASIEKSPDYKPLILERLLDWEWEFHHWMQTHPMPVKEISTPITDDPHNLWRGMWQARRIACPFLDLETNFCSIYDDRPATCRGHHACYPPDGTTDIAAPPEGCFTKIEDVRAGHMTPIWQLNNELCEIFAQVLAKALEASQIEWTGHLLPIMVLTVGRSRFNWPLPNWNKRRAKPPRVQVARKEMSANHAPEMD
jgi:Fe-S-cluster containining protein